MKVLQVLNSLEPEDGGPAEAGIQLNRWANTFGDVSVEGVYWARRRSRSDDELEGTVFEPLPRGPLLAGGLIALWRRVGMADACYIQGIYVPISLLAALLCVLRRTDFYLHAHGIFEPYERRRMGLRVDIADMLLVNFLLRRSQAVIFDTEAEASAAELSTGVRREVVLLGGAGFYPIRQNLGQRVLFFGRVTGKKRTDLLLSAWPALRFRHPDATLRIVGPDPDGLLPRPELLADSGIEVTGPRHGRAKDDVWREADIFVLPSENENFAIAAAEAASWGLACVLSKEVALAPLLEECGGAVVVSDLSVEALEASVEKVLSDASLRLQISRNGQRFAQKELSWHAAAQRLTTLLGGRT